MVKRLFSIALAIVVVFGSISFIFADEPVRPNVEGLSVEDANVLIEAYNQEVDDYNNQLDEDYNAAVEAVNAHNAAEDAKVAENQTEIQAYEKIEQRIEKDALKGITDNRTTEWSELPTTWESTVTTGAAITFKIEEATDKALETYKAINIHLYLNGNDGTYVGTNVSDDSFEIDEGVADYFVLGEWETVTLDTNDIVTVISESESMGYRSAAFYRYLPGYTNGYWMPSVSEFVSLCNDVVSTWYKGAATEFSYDMGARYGQIKNVFSVYTYEFVRLGEEPVAPVPYSPEYLESPAQQVHLEHMELLQATPKEPVNEPNEPEQPQDPENPTGDDEEPTTPEDPIDDPDVPTGDEEPETPIDPIDIPENPTDTPEDPIETPEESDTPIDEPEIPEESINEEPAAADPEPENPVVESVDEPETLEIPEIKPTHKPKPNKTDEEPVIEPISEPEVEEMEDTFIPDEDTPMASYEIEEPIEAKPSYAPAPVPVTKGTVMQTEEEETVDEPLPVFVADVEEVEEEEIPLTEPEQKTGQVWALINLIIMILTVLALLKLDERKYNIVSIILAVGSILIFVFTENVHNPMVLVDRWTILMVVVYICMLISRLVSPKEDKNEEEVEE